MTTGKLDQVLAQAREYKASREQGYRERALKMYPWVCGRCAREFSHKNLSELTVHHRDHNHDNNPNDGSNWELLCLYCHDNEHSRFEELVQYGDTRDGAQAAATYSPFAGLKDMLAKK
ncbi:YajD family HNH nuclease [Shewanella avicenniae]|uniref:Putative HNH nuclease YajD n=1 Tax=Shewanella avicenniae TaxID=2814294 RepID=A0ABX7QWD1_9GAMM|nr:YajD family HNH nuclease [Shewanella avicenniae]QSX34955.1 YajD family HNH nuclease [Shewanella avicenniae]